MPLNNTDLVRFRRPKRKRWQILLDETGIKTRDELRDAAFVNPLTGKLYRYVPPRKRKRSRRRSRPRRARISYAPKANFKLRMTKMSIRTIKPGYFTKENAFGIRIPVVQFTNIMETPVSPVNIQSLQVEKTWTESHPGPPYTEGGPFTNIKIKFDDDDIRGVGRYTTKPAQRVNGEYSVYNGGFCNPTFSGESVSFATYRDTSKAPSQNALLPGFSQYGPIAYAKLRPNPEQVDLGQFFAEIRELPRALSNLQKNAKEFHSIWDNLSFSRFKDSPVMRPKWAADEFVGYQFGWSPFLRDLEAAYNLKQNFKAFEQEVTRLNNTWVRKRTVIDEVETSTLVSRNFNSGFYPSGNFLNDMCLSFSYGGSNCFYVSDVYLEEKTRIWAEGSFKFYRPEFDSSLADYSGRLNELQRSLTLYGLRVSPSLLWKITPWTWLIDWATRVGDNMSNITGMLVDSVTSKYMYVMHHKIRDFVQKSTLNTWDRGPIAMSWTRRVETKQRDGQLSPYGFNVQPASLSAKQWSILAALGISKLS